MLETTKEEQAEWDEIAKDCLTDKQPEYPVMYNAIRALCRDVDTLVAALGAYYAAWSPSNGQRGWKIDPQGMRRAHEKARAVLDCGSAQRPAAAG